MDKLKLAEQALIKEDVPNFRAGDRVNVHYRVREGEKERIQQFEGDVISRKGSGANQTFMVRKISFGNIGVERIFPLNSPYIAKIEIVKEGDVKRSKLYYLRDRSGKSARIKEKDRGIPGEDEEEAESRAAEEPVAEDEVENEPAAAETEDETDGAPEEETKDSDAGEARVENGDSDQEISDENNEDPEAGADDKKAKKQQAATEEE